MDDIPPELDNIFLNFLNKFANLSPWEEEGWVEYLKEYWLRVPSRGVVLQEPNFNGIVAFDNFSPKEKQEWTDRCRLLCKSIKQQQSGILLQVQ